MLTAGLLSLLWLVLRSGPKPSRLAYPCQQAVFGTAAAAFGAPLVAATLALRGRALELLRPLVSKLSLGGLVALTLVAWTFASSDRRRATPLLAPPEDYHPAIYVVSDARGIGPGRYGGVDDLIALMGMTGLKWHRSTQTTTTAGPDGMIDPDVVVLLKINAQWAERGGTNTDVLRGVIRQIVEHPDGFAGEVIVADNGQGSGSLTRTENNAEDHHQSPQDVVDDFAAEGWNVTTMLWDTIRSTSVAEYDTGNMTDGYVVSPTYDPETTMKVSYPKFRSQGGHYVSYKHGIWSPATEAYDADGLVVINMPVFKTHSIYAVTAAVKNHMGVVTTRFSTRSHDAVDDGGMGTLLAEVRLPNLTILDCIWIFAHPEMGPQAYYEYASRRDQLVAGRDPVALDAWATRFIMIPQIIENGYSYAQYHDTQDPDHPGSVFRTYLDASMGEMLAAGIDTTNDYNAADVYSWNGPAIPVASAWTLAVTVLLMFTAGTILQRSRRI